MPSNATIPAGPADRAWDDTVLPFQLDGPGVRGRVAKLDSTLEGILRQHDYPAAVESLVAEMALLTALVGQTVNLRWKLSLQVQSRGAVGMIATDYFAPGALGEHAGLRAYARFDRDRLDGREPFRQLEDGYFAILIDQGEGTTPYRGVTPLAGASLANCAESYFAQSEQLPTRIALATAGGGETGAGAGGGNGTGGVSRWYGGGMMLQHLPETSPHVEHGDTSDTEARILQARAKPEGAGAAGSAADMAGPEATEDWRRINLLMDTLRDRELADRELSPPDLLVRLFHEEGPRAFDAQPLRFDCTCSETRVRQSLSIYSARDIEKMTTPEGSVTADCQFCGARYELDPATVGLEAGGREDAIGR